ncbi:hypothetical protein CYLTODRAFT_451514 [Cylindrobasidium torrendii FP15055 ss-10]|uniref:Uncharacterized protein n=1 Tax=Cylindrobasidium torrendii FP15055 ss-10 TaxID=1314674 RepID=A0A0D7BKG4_9AGAR|nr:hypothetical protein CYLTODRAFT_451514 [Cylindrobasidium torrendii FP15055 ss-10]
MPGRVMFNLWREGTMFAAGSIVAVQVPSGHLITYQALIAHTSNQGNKPPNPMFWKMVPFA